MLVFLSYAHQHRSVAEEIVFALKGHQVFFDRDSLAPGREFHDRIRTGVEESDALIFLVSPESVKKGSFALTELKYAREKWPHPQQRIFPVMVAQTTYEDIPPYLRSVTIFEPEGDVAAGVVDEFEKWAAIETDAGGSPHRQPPTTPAPDPSPQLFEILPGAWQIQIRYPNGMMGQATAELFPTGLFRVGGSSPMANFVIEGNWQVLQPNLIMLTGQQNLGLLTFPFNVTFQFSQITQRFLLGVMSTGESMSWYRVG